MILTSFTSFAFVLNHFYITFITFLYNPAFNLYFKTNSFLSMPLISMCAKSLLLLALLARANAQVPASGRFPD